jgi:hypothetical protein
MPRPRNPLSRWTRAAAWLLGWVAIVVLAPFVPLGVAIALAVALFAGQILAGAGGSACDLPPERGPDVTKGPCRG